MKNRNFVSRYHIKSKKSGQAVKIISIEYVGGTLQLAKFSKRFIGHVDKLSEILHSIPASDAIWREETNPTSEKGSYQHIKNFAGNEFLYVHRCKVKQVQAPSEKLNLWFRLFKYYKGFDYHLEPKDRTKIEACDFANSNYMNVYFKGHKSNYWEFKAGTISNFTSKKNAIHGFVAKEREKLVNPYDFKPEPSQWDFYKIKEQDKKKAYLAFYKRKGFRTKSVANGKGGVEIQWYKPKPTRQLVQKVTSNLIAK